MAENSEEKGVVKYTSRDGQHITLSKSIIKRFLVSGYPELVTDQELYLYMGVCKSRGLNPFIQDCYLIKYSKTDKAAIVVSIDYYRKRARAQADCKGWKNGIALVNGRGEIERREGCLLLQGEELVGAWFEAKPDGWDVPMRKEINLAPYIKKTRDGNITAFWKEEKQPEQIAKVAESQGLRACWPDEFQGLYTDAERESAEAQQELTEAIKKEDEAAEDAGEKLKEKFGEAKEKPKGAPKAPAESEPLPPEEPADENDESLGPWMPANWKNLRKPGFSTYVHEHLKADEQKAAFTGLPASLQAQIIDKWHNMYVEPFPQTEISEKQKPAEEDPEPELSEATADGPDPEAEERAADGPDPEAEERAAVIDKIVAEFDETLIFKAKTVLSFATRSWPPTLDGCNVLYEKCQELNE